MKYAGLLFVCLIICLSCIAGVCAGDVNETGDLNYKINQELGIGLESVSLSDLNEDSVVEKISDENDVVCGNCAESDGAIGNGEDKNISNLNLRDYYILDYGKSLNITVGMEGVSGISARIGDENVEVYGNRILITGLNAGNHTLTVTAIPDGNHTAVTKTSTVTVNKVDALMSVSDIDLNYGNSVSIKINADGVKEFIAKIGDRDADVNGNIVSIPKMDAGNYTLTVIAVPDENHNSVTRTSKITVNKVDSLIEVADINVTYGSPVDVIITSKGAIKCIAKIDDADISVIDNVITIPVLNIGKYTLTVMTVPDANHNPATRTANITVSKAKSRLLTSNYNVTAGQRVTLNVIVSSNELVNEGVITFFYGNTEIGKANVNNGIAAISYTPLKSGIHSLFVVYDGSSKYESSNSTIILNVAENSNTDDNNSAQPNNTKVIVVPSIDNILGEVYVEIIFQSDVTGNVTFTVNNNKYLLTLQDGAAKVKLPDLKEGDWPYIVEYSGNGKYRPFSDSGVFKVNKTNATPVENVTQSKIDLKISVPSLYGLLAGDLFEIRLPDDATGNVTLRVNDINHVFKVSNGVAKVIVPELGDGNCPYTITYSGDDKYLSFSGSGNFKNANASPNHSNNSSEPKTSLVIAVPSFEGLSAGDSVVIKLPEDAAGNVTLTLNNEVYVFSVSDGICSVKLPELAKGDYQYAITYSGDAKYSSFSNEGTFKVDDNGKTSQENAAPDKSKIIASNVKVTYSAGSYYTIKVYGSDGKLADAAVKISGKISKTLTAKNGIAKFKITQAPGTYKITISASGKSVTKTITVKHLVTLKTVTVKKSAKKLVLQANLGKINGKYLKNKKVTFKFNGKKYAAKTNAKGVAKVTIKSSVLKKLKAGKKVTYQATYSKDTVKKNAKVAK